MPLADFFSIRLGLLVGFKGRYLQIEHAPAFAAAQADIIADHIQLSDSDRFRMHLDTGRKEFFGRRHRLGADHFAAKRNRSHSRHDLFSHHLMCHTTGGTGDEQPALPVHSFKG